MFLNLYVLSEAHAILVGSILIGVEFLHSLSEHFSRAKVSLKKLFATNPHGIAGKVPSVIGLGGLLISNF